MKFNNNQNIIFKSKKCFPWAEGFLIMFLLIIYIFILINIILDKISIGDWIFFIVTSPIYFFIILFVFFMFGENQVTIFMDQLIIYPKLSEKIFNSKPIKINIDNIKEIKYAFLYVNILLYKKIIYEKKEIDYVSINFNIIPNINKKNIINLLRKNKIGKPRMDDKMVKEVK